MLCIHNGRLLFLALAGLLGLTTVVNATGSFMVTGARATQPVGHYEFCKQVPKECQQKSPKRPPVELSRGLWAALVKVNDTVNAIVEPRTDLEMWGREEVWSFPDGEGDCEDYALEKRRRLIAIGVPAGNLLMTVVRQRNGDGHAVLTVRTGTGDFVLDNLETRVLAWKQTGYTFLKRQSETNSGVWVKVNDGHAEAVASVR